VECLSDIANADGMQIREEWLEPNTTKPSRSLKKWPHQEDPGEEAWKIWKNFLIRGFLNNKNLLTKQLGGWERGNGMRLHQAYLQPHSNYMWLYREEHHWTTHQMIHSGRRQITFQRQASQHFQHPLLGFRPIDIIGETPHSYITGREATVAKEVRKNQTAHNLYNKLAQRSTETLLHKIKLMTDEADLHETFRQTVYIDIATDGSYDPETGISSFGWAIMINDFVAATGQGPAEAHPAMADPLRAEAYGLASSALFMDILTNHYSINTNEHVWTIHLDNMGLIKQMETIPQDSQSPKWNFTPHADIIQTAYENLKQFPVTYSYIKAHQDKSEGAKNLSRAATLNIMADNLAQQHREEMTQAHCTVSTSHVHLKINDIIITKDHQRWLLDTSSRIPIEQYYKDKYKWKASTFHKVNWQAQQKVLTCYDSNDQRRILKFCHGWLPTYDRLHREHQTPSQRCPLCYFLIENNTHLFACKHPGQQVIIQALFKKIDNDNMFYGVNEITDLLKVAIQQKTTPELQHGTEDSYLKRTIQDQKEIGWSHIMFGRIAMSTSRFIDITLKQRGCPKWQNSGERWTQRMTQNIWDTFLSLWNNRNTIIYEDQHKSNHDIIRERLRMKVENCYLYADKLSFNDRQKIFYMDEKDLMNEDPRYIKAWLKNAGRIIRVNKAEAKRKSKEKQLMENYFKWRTHTKTPLKKRKRTRHQKQDLRPD
jgi:hypothetical protein